MFVVLDEDFMKYPGLIIFQTYYSGVFGGIIVLMVQFVRESCIYVKFKIEMPKSKIVTEELHRYLTNLRVKL